MGGSMMTPPLDASSPLDGGIRKRVCKACDRCRLKKSKCDGSTPCSRCKSDNAICVFGERKRSHDKIYPKGYVEMLENQQAQLVTGLQELYKRAQMGQSWMGARLKETSAGVPLTHDILESLGALQQEGHPGSDTFEEDLAALQARLVANGATMMKREMSHDSSSDSAPSPAPFEHISSTSRPKFSNPFSTAQYPPTPPNQSPYPQSVRAVPQLKSHTYPQLTTQSNLNYATPLSEFDDSMQYMGSYDSPMMDQTMDTISFPNHMYHDHLANGAINPYVTMKDWPGQDEFQRYVNPAMI